MTLGENLQRLRKGRGLSQEEVARRLFVSRQSVSKWELDQSEPGVEYLKALAELYGVSLDELAGIPVPTPQPEPVPEEDPGPGPEEESGASLYRITFGVRTVTAILANILFSLPRGSLNFPLDWVAMLVGLFVRKRAVWWIVEVCLWLNVVYGVLGLFAEPGLGIIALVQAGAFLCLFFTRKIKGYFHMTQPE